MTDYALCILIGFMLSWVAGVLTEQHKTHKWKVRFEQELAALQRLANQALAEVNHTGNKKNRTMWGDD